MLFFESKIKFTAINFVYICYYKNKHLECSIFYFTNLKAGASVTLVPTNKIKKKREYANKYNWNGYERDARTSGGGQLIGSIIAQGTMVMMTKQF
jgi:hypothetical protein